MGMGHRERAMRNRTKNFDVLATTHIKLLYISAVADRFKIQNQCVNVSKRNERIP